MHMWNRRFCSLRIGRCALVLRLQDVCDHGRAAAADVLGHTETGTGYLVIPGLTTQLLHDLSDLVDAGGADGMAARLLPGDTWPNRSAGGILTLRSTGLEIKRNNLVLIRPSQ